MILKSIIFFQDHEKKKKLVFESERKTQKPGASEFPKNQKSPILDSSPLHCPTAC